MSGPTIQQLLGLPADVTQPHAYQVFGLQPGENDPAVLKAAIKARIASLKQAKSTADPAVWKKAAGVVQSAQGILHDASAKAELDARFGIVAPPAKAAADDPLAGLLPTAPTSSVSTSHPETVSSRENTVQPAVAPTTPPAVPISQSQDATPIHAVPLHAPTAVVPSTSFEPATEHSLAPTAAPVIASRRPIRRRRSWGGLVFGSAFLVGLFAIVGSIAYFAFWGPGQLRIVRGNGQVTIQTGPAAESPDGPNVAQPRSVEPKAGVPEPTSDSIMKTPEPIVPGESEYSLREASQVMQSQAAAARPGSMDFDGSGANSDLKAGPRPTSPTPSPEPSMVPKDTPVPPAMPSPPPAMDAADPSEKREPSEADLLAGQQAIAAAREALANASWTTMVSLATTAQTTAAGVDQVDAARTIFETAELADYYRDAISRGMANLKAGNEFKLTPTLDVIVVESSATAIQVRRGTNIKAYELDDLPLVVADALAPLAVPSESPTVIAARAVYQSISPRGTPEHRTEAIQILSGLEPIQGARPPEIAKLLAALPPR
ncbi:MAG: hypothetical protein AAGJ40_04275 [Planctomycetota bacterium]